MSRVAKSPVAIPSGVEVKIGSDKVTVKGAKGSLELALTGTVSINQENDQLTFVANDSSKSSRAMSGTTRALLNNMVQGCLLYTSPSPRD